MYPFFRKNVPKKECFAAPLQQSLYYYNTPILKICQPHFEKNKNGRIAYSNSPIIKKLNTNYFLLAFF